MQHELQDMMQDLVGIVRVEGEMQEALEVIESLKERAAAVGVAGNREYNPGWHTALDLPNLLTVIEAIARCRPRAARRAAADISATTIPTRIRRSARSTSSSARRPMAAWSSAREPIPAMRRAPKQVIEEMK